MASPLARSGLLVYEKRDADTNTLLDIVGAQAESLQVLLDSQTNFCGRNMVATTRWPSGRGMY